MYEPTSASNGVDLTLQAISKTEHPRAICNDGTEGRYEWRQAVSTESRDLWVIVLQSGGWAHDRASYDSRDAVYTSSSSYGALGTTSRRSGVFHSKNYHLRHANIVYARYCTSDALRIVATRTQLEPTSSSLLFCRNP